MTMQSQLRWCGHVHWMPDSHIPKQLLYEQPADSARNHGGQRKRNKDHLCLTLKSCDISNSSWESIASDRFQWRHLCHSSLVQFENHRIASLDDRRKNQARASNLTVNIFSWMTCGCTCTSQIGMYAHQKQCNSTSTMDRRSRATTSTGSASMSWFIPPFTCSTCGRTCTSHIGMFAHHRDVCIETARLVSCTARLVSCEWDVKP